MSHIRINALIQKYGFSILNNYKKDDQRIIFACSRRSVFTKTNEAGITLQGVTLNKFFTGTKGQILFTREELKSSVFFEEKEWIIYSTKRHYLNNKIAYYESVVLENDFDREATFYKQEIEPGGVNMVGKKEQYATFNIRFRTLKAKEREQMARQGLNMATAIASVAYSDLIKVGDRIEIEAKNKAYEILEIQDINERNEVFLLTLAETRTETRSNARINNSLQ